MTLSKPVSLVRCYHCRNPTLQETQANKVYKCVFCGKSINMKKARVYFKSTEQYELRLAHREQHKIKE